MLAAALALVAVAAPAASAQTGYNPPAWWQSEIDFIQANNPVADCSVKPDPNFEGLGIDAWYAVCEARGVDFLGSITSFQCSASAEFASSYQAGPGYHCRAWKGSGAIPTWEHRCDRDVTETPGYEDLYPDSWYTGRYTGGGIVEVRGSYPALGECLAAIGLPPDPPPPPPDERDTRARANAVDDGVIYVDRDLGQKAKPETVDVLENDTPSGLVIDGLGQPGHGEAVAPGIDGDGRIRFSPPSKNFVGRVEIPYTARRPSDPVGSGDGATLTLLYRLCRVHQINLVGTTLNLMSDVARLEGKLRVCSDGKRMYTEVVEQKKVEGFRYRLNTAFGQVISRLSSALTRGVLTFSSVGEWRKLAKPGAGGLAGQLVVCDKWTIKAGAVISAKARKRIAAALRKALRLRNASEKYIERVIKLLGQRSFKRGCFTALSYRAGNATSTQASYSVKITVHHEATAGMARARLDAGNRYGEVTSGPYSLGCKLIREKPTELVFGTCKWRRTR